MRLIDADNIVDSDIANALGVEYYSCLPDIRDMLNDEPTAFDLDEVIRKLEFEMQKAKEEVENGRGLLIKEPYTPYIKAIQIVKEGIYGK